MVRAILEATPAFAVGALSDQNTTNHIADSDLVARARS